jgi:hypothetical protein
MEDRDRVQHKTNRARGMDALFVYPLQKKTSYGRCKKQVLEGSANSSEGQLGKRTNTPNKLPVGSIE